VHCRVMIADWRLKRHPAFPVGRIRLVKWRILIVGCAVAALILPLPARVVERYYSSTFFPSIQPAVTGASNLTSMAWLDVLIVVAGASLLTLCIRDLSRSTPARAVIRVASRVVTVAAFLYLAFLAMWGLNYRREALRQKVPYDAARITQDRALALARETVVRVNAMHGAAHAEGWSGPADVDLPLARAFAAATSTLKLPGTPVPGRPKHSLLDLYFRRAGVSGMTDPFFLETLVASDILPFERPHVVAHEWAHLAGVTDEGEANFVGWLACVRGSAPHRYSGWLFLYSEVMDVLPRDVARGVSASLASGPRADLLAIRERGAREVSPRLQSAGWGMYDRYLKANRVDAGTASYGEVVQLVLGTDLR
jgi:hypothetical protein